MDADPPFSFELLRCPQEAYQSLLWAGLEEPQWLHPLAGGSVGWRATGRVNPGFIASCRMQALLMG